jgi:biopolymer transport protein ExbD
MKQKNNILLTEDKADLTPMIDVVFLLLIYFMATTQLIKEETDIGITLPSNTAPAKNPEHIPSEHFVDILEDGQVLLNGAPMDTPESRDMPQLTKTLTRLGMADQRMNIPTIVTIQADDESMHQRSIDVLNACAAAGIKTVSFGAGAE